MRGSEPTILMCRPDYFGIEYEINPWMDSSRGADREKAVVQWTALTEILRSLGATLELLEPVPGLPDLVFTANAGCVRQQTFVPSHFRHPERERESPIFEQWFVDHGWQVERLRTPAKFEGAGDALYCGDRLFAGYLNRSDVASHTFLATAFSCEVLSLALVDPRFYHLDTCFCPLAPGVAIYFPPAFDEYGRKVIEANIPTLIEADSEEAAEFACNAVVVGTNVVHNSGCPKLAAALTRHGYQSHQTPLSEFLKSGGSAKCLTLRLDGEEAATW